MDLGPTRQTEPKVASHGELETGVVRFQGAMLSNIFQPKHPTLCLGSGDAELPYSSVALAVLTAPRIFARPVLWMSWMAAALRN